MKGGLCGSIEQKSDCGSNNQKGSERKVSKCMVYCSSCEEEANKFEMLTWPLNSSDLSTPSEVQWSLYLSGSGLFVSNNTSAPIRSAEDWSNYKPRGWDVGTLHIVYYVYVGSTLWNTRVHIKPEHNKQPFWIWPLYTVQPEKSQGHLFCFFFNYKLKDIGQKLKQINNKDQKYKLYGCMSAYCMFVDYAVL